MRVVLQLAAAAIFTFQMQVALTKYFEFMTTPLSSTKNMSEVKLPDIFICPKEDDIFNTTRLWNEGYRAYNAFLMGHIFESNGLTSWEGWNMIPYINLTNIVFGRELDEELLIVSKEHLKSTENFNALNGFCRKVVISLSALQHVLVIYHPGEYQVLIADPDRSSFHTVDTESFQGDIIETQTNRAISYTLAIEEIQWIEGNGECTNYGEGAAFKTYADCVANEYTKALQPVLGCMIPWLAGPSEKAVCTGTLQASQEQKEKIFRIVRKILLAREFQRVERLKGCPRPCTEIKMTSKQTRIKAGFPGMQEVALSFQYEVRVTKYRMAYGVFDLVVEIGSSLGLWIGLSALGILDLLIQAGVSSKAKIEEIIGPRRREI